MKESGEIISIDERGVRIKMTPSSDCSTCSNHAHCQIGEGSRILNMPRDKFHNVEVSVGKRVTLETKEWQVILSSAIMFILPVLILIISYLLLSYWGVKEGKAMGISFASAALFFLVIFILDRLHLLKFAEPRISLNPSPTDLEDNNTSS